MRSLLQILQCPVCTAKLSSTDRCGSCSTDFLRVGGCPVLIDFEDSIYTPTHYSESAARATARLRPPSWLARVATGLTRGANQLAQRNFGRLVRLLESDAPARVLVIGGGSVGAGVEVLYQSQAVELVCVDVYASPQVVLICDAHKLPFEPGSFDAAVIQAVLEHVLEPQRVVNEIHRVLRPQGLVYAETPFMQQVHEGPYDFSRFTFSGHRWLFRSFEQVDAGQVMGPGTALLWSISYLARAVGAGKRLEALAAAPFFWLRYLDRLARGGRALDAASALYFLGRKSDRPMKASELPSYYLNSR